MNNHENFVWFLFSTDLMVTMTFKSVAFNIKNLMINAPKNDYNKNEVNEI